MRKLSFFLTVCAFFKVKQSRVISPDFVSAPNEQNGHQPLFAIKCFANQLFAV